jgi:NAD(P)-dependent dehydrogenase (short-subunit alcohol dehydrogenase family)
MVAEAFRQVNPDDPKKAETEYASANPTKRLGLPEEVARVVIFLLSEDASYVNGQTIAIDGGSPTAMVMCNDKTNLYNSDQT